MANAEIVVIRKHGKVFIGAQPIKTLFSDKAEHRNVLGISVLGKFVLGEKN